MLPVSDTPQDREGGVVAALCAVAFLSGSAALLFETLWFRVAGVTFGNGVWASSIVLASFMAGLALGNALAGSLAWRIARPIRFYAGLELGIGLSGAVLVWIVPALTGTLAQLFAAVRDTPWLLNAVRFPFSFVLMMVPATAMGATLPVLVKAAFGERQVFGRVLGRLYGWNTMGAVAGALIGEAWLIGAIGIRGSALAAAGLDAAAAGGALVLAHALEPTAVARPAAAPRARIGLTPLRLLAAAFLAGAIFLALEVVWFRFLSLRVIGTSLVFAVLLAVVLVGISAGGLLASRWLQVRSRAGPALPALALAGGALVLGCYALFDPISRLVLPGGGELSGSMSDPLRVVLISAPLMLPVALLSGVLFTAVGDAAREGLLEAARTTGLVTLANTLGGAAGSLLAGFVLLPRLGIERSLIALAAAYVGVAACVWIPALGVRGRRPLASAGALAAAFALALALFPHGLLERHLPHGLVPGVPSRIVAVREGRIQTLVYTETDRFGKPLFYNLFTDGFSMSGTRTGGRRYMKAFVYLPATMHPDLRRALLISYGVGSTAKALTNTPSLESIDVVDISSEILEMSRIIYPDPADHPLNDPRVHVHVEDGRFFLQTTRQRFDLITGEPPPPKYAGVVNLYTREYFELLHSRLAEGGMATYWLPVHTLMADDSRAIIRAFCDVFADCTLWNGSGMDWILLGTRDAQGPVSAEHFRLPWSDPARLPELEALGFEIPEQLLATFMAGPQRLAEFTKGTPPLVDDFPHRLSPEVTIQSPERERLYRTLLETGRSRRDFERSAVVSRLVPEPLRLAALPWFEWQALANSLAAGSGKRMSLAQLHEVLTQSPLRTLPLWMLVTSAEEQRLVRALPEAQQADPPVQNILGRGALAARDYAGAARLFRAAYEARDSAPLAHLAMFALCMDGDLDQAEEVARYLVDRHGERVLDDAQWRWFESTFGLADPRGR